VNLGPELLAIPFIIHTTNSASGGRKSELLGAVYLSTVQVQKVTQKIRSKFSQISANILF